MSWRQNSGESGVAWLVFGPFALQVQCAEIVDGNVVESAKWYVVADGEMLHDENVDGDPSLAELKRLAFIGACQWLDALKRLLSDA